MGLRVLLGSTTAPGRMHRVLAGVDELLEPRPLAARAIKPRAATATN